MKKMISMLLALAMVFALAACGGNNTPATEAPTEPALAYKLEGTMEELVNQVVAEQPVEFMGGVMPVDLADTSEDGLWAIKNYTGLDSAEQISDVAVYEPMMGSIPFSLVMVRVQEGYDPALVAEAMKSGIDQRKWICVEADDLKVAAFGDVVMLIMVGSDTGLTAQSYVDAFTKVCAAQYEGAQPEFVLE
ncbi:MAG: hypothetical protein IKT52_11750 [Oscillospiraceae bacterium]|nr:hypothetical protein [Oscillospiraceae bacterium]